MHLVDLGVFVDVDRQESYAKASQHAHVFDSTWAFEPIRFVLVSCDSQPSLLLLSLSASLPLSTSLHIVMHTDSLRKLETVLEDGVTHGQLLFQDVVSVHVLAAQVALPLRHVTSATLTLILHVVWPSPSTVSPPLVQSPVTPPHTHNHTYMWGRWCSKAGRLSSEAVQPLEAPTVTSTGDRRRRAAHEMRWRAVWPLQGFLPGLSTNHIPTVRSHRTRSTAWCSDIGSLTSRNA